MFSGFSLFSPVRNDCLINGQTGTLYLNVGKDITRGRMFRYIILYNFKLQNSHK
jgi:hypothetical protein